MGKATIISRIADGQYNVTINFDRSRSDAEIVRINAENIAITARLSELTGEISSAALLVDNASQTLQTSITNLVANTGDQATVTARQRELQAVTGVYNNLLTVENIAQLKKIANEKRLAWLQQNIAADINTTAWCADYNDSLTGDVGLIDIGRKQGANIIKPGGTNADQAVYAAATDGKYEPLASSTPAGCFYNLAMLPGVEKWKPRYRTGTITALDTAADIADVTLDAAISDQGININQTGTLSAVPVQYMICNATAFAVNDHVIIEFIGQDWASPRVVGFVNHPKACYGWVLVDVAFSTQSTPEGMGRYEMTDMLVLNDVTRPAGAIAPSINDVLIGTVPVNSPIGTDPTTVQTSLYRANRSGLDVSSASPDGYWYYGNHPYPNATRPGVTPPPGIVPISPNPDRVISWPNLVNDRRPNYWTGRLRTYKWQAPMIIACNGNVGTIVNGTSFSVKNGSAPYSWSITMESPLPATHPTCLVADDPDGWTATIIAPTTYDLPVGQGTVVCTDTNGLSVAIEVAFGDFSVAIPLDYEFIYLLDTLPVWDWHWPTMQYTYLVGAPTPWLTGTTYMADTNDHIFVILKLAGPETGPDGLLYDGYYTVTIASSGGALGSFVRLITKPAGNVRQTVTEDWWSDSSTAAYPLPPGFAQTRIPGSGVDSTGLVLRAVTGENTISQP